MPDLYESAFRKVNQTPRSRVVIQSGVCVIRRVWSILFTPLVQEQ